MTRLLGNEIQKKAQQLWLKSSLSQEQKKRSGIEHLRSTGRGDGKGGEGWREDVTNRDKIFSANRIRVPLETW